MSTENSIDTKMQTPDPENNGNLITTIDPQGMLFKEFYHEQMVERRISQGKEAWSLGKSQSQVSQWLDPYSNRHLPVYLAVRSELGDDIIGWMAQQRGGFFTSRVGALNGSKKDELSAILKACAEITANDANDALCSAQFDIILEAAKRGRGECK